MYTIEDKVILISGGCGGLGFAYAKEFLNKKAKGVSLIDIDETIGKEKEEELNKEYGRNKAIFIKGFVDDSDSYKNAFEKTVEYFRQLDIVINNAAILNEFEWRQSIDVNIKGTIEGTNLALYTYLPKYKSCEEGVLINISSIAGLQAPGSFPVYTATKYAITGFTKTYSFDKYREKFNTRVLCMCPGNTKTNIYNTMGMKLQPKDVAELKQTFGPVIRQDPSIVAKALCKMIETAKHGTFWSVENEKTYEINFGINEPIKKLL